MKFTITYTWDSKLMIQRIKCFFRHKWIVEQWLMRVQNGTDDERDLVIAYKRCERCCKTKLIHILK